MHCAVAVKGNIIRLCDLDSHSGTYVENQRVSTAPLGYFSEFRIGSSVLLLTVLVAQGVATLENRDRFKTGKE
jgi:pSer/pThr/pTyr-binding forkhead associated (FHA) protein